MRFSSRRLGVWLLLAGGLLLRSANGAAQMAPERVSDVRRALTLISVVAEEYREGVVDGQVVLPVEYEEARTFLDEAEHRLDGTVAATAELTAVFASLRAVVDARRPLAEVRAYVDQLRAGVSSVTGVTEEVFPPQPPSASSGRALFAQNCVPCHGEHANGQGPDAAKLQPPPANFTDPAFMRVETPFDFFHIISVGKGASAMPAWGEVFSLQERWDLVSYLWTVRPGTAQLAEGQGIYLQQCAGCHGATGDGRGNFSAALLKPAPELNRAQALAQKNDTEIYAAVANGVAGTPMPSFARTLDEDDIWATVAYVRSLSLGGEDGSKLSAGSREAEARRFAGLLRVLSEEYQKAMAAGTAPDPVEYAEASILLEQVTRNRDAVLTATAERAPDEVEPLRARLRELGGLIEGRQPAARVATLVSDVTRTLEARFPLAETAPEGRGDAVAETRRLLGTALGAYRDGNPRALYLVSDAYFAFEPLEKQLGVSAPDITRRVEDGFLKLRGAMAKPGADETAAALVGEIERDLDAASAALKPGTGAYAIAFQSAAIIVREGFEVVLIIGALLAYVLKSGNTAMKRPIVWGAAGGVAGSLATAYLFIQVLKVTGVAAETLEGVAMLLAAAVLFFVSYWLISKAEADKWQRYIQGKVKTALASGSGLALAAAAFLAVYREGVETVLFYQALLASAAGQTSAVVGGFGVGSVALAFIGVGFVRFGMRIPIRPFFLGTSFLLYYLAFVFAGKGVAELQSAGWIDVSPVAWLPSIPFLGIYPTVETALAQGVLLACLIYAIWVTLRARPAPAKAEVLLVEAAKLREVAVQIRSELVPPLGLERPPVELASQRLETLIGQVSELEHRIAAQFRVSGGVKP